MTVNLRELAGYVESPLFLAHSWLVNMIVYVIFIVLILACRLAHLTNTRPQSYTTARGDRS
jgi:hypothetical protein